MVNKCKLYTCIKESKNIKRVEMEEAGKQLLDTLNWLKPFNSEKSLDQLENDIWQYTKFLEKSIIWEIDNKPTGSESNVDKSLYGKIIRAFLSTFDENFSILKERLNTSIENLMIVKGSNFLMLHELLASITEYLKESMNEDAVEFMILMLEKILKSDALVSSIVSACKIKSANELKREEYEKARRDYIQIVISLPVKVSNKVKGRQICETFSINNFSKIISFQIIGTITLLNEELNRDTAVCDVKALSLLISKLLSNFESENFVELIEIMIHLSLEDKNSLRSLVQDILMNISRASIASIALLFLENIENPNDVEKILGVLMKHENWKFILMKKFLFFSYFNNDKIIINLINCLLCEDSEQNFINLIIKLLDIWGDRSALNHTTLEQQEFITKIILLLMKKVNGKLKPMEKDSIQELLFSGTSAHLESIQVEIRAIGMITGELIVNYFNEPDRPKLKYDYDSMPKEGVNIVCKLKKFFNEKCDNSYYCSSYKNITSEALIIKLGVKSKILLANDEINIDNKEMNDTTNSNNNNDDNDDDVKNNRSEFCPSNYANDDSLDSDDDLIPYDMSNDRKSCENHRPMYLRELKEILVDSTVNTDPRIFAESLECCEKLLMSQLPNDDASLALELLSIISKLTEITYVKNFNILKFKACVTITKIYPKISAEYLCREFHATVGSHSVNDRLFFLNVLAEAARQLSKVEVNNETMNDKEMYFKNIKRKSQIQSVSKPIISLFVNSDIGKKVETLYDDDDFEISKHLDAEKCMTIVENEKIIAQRIKSKTKVFAHPSKRSLTTINQFNDVASYFFYPLFYGIRTRDENNIFNTPKHFEDHSNLLLINFIKTLSTIMVAAENCIVAPKMARELLEFAWNMRFHEQAMVRCCVIESIAAVIVAVSKSNFTGVIFDLLLELRIWLMDVSHESSREEPYGQCKEMAINVINLIDSLFPSL
ncbi:telomere length regulation protein TEL2 homolog [Diachasma alloeum]|uniref:telomere length regulation protein TEL2 homolog n=1 Tax=Diachasma alloeum TaxID=454923 RepID=UPI0007382BD4|nr:telomere length regulation protein TEL2 homolog [Diachasma alloeum]